MKRFVLLLIPAMMLGIFASPPAQAQFDLIKKIKKKAEDKAEDKAVERIFGEEEESAPGQEPRKSTDSPTNKRGSGLTHEPPDVLMNIDEAGKSFSGKKYSDARFAIRQAIMGIELTIGNNILENLPESIDGLPAMADEDQVASSGIGFVGLIIERNYRKGERQLKVTIGNDAGLLSAANMYLASGAHYSSTSSDDNHKIIKIGDDRAVLEYDEYSGYKLSMPFGQSSILVTEGINFDNEQQIIAATEEIDINHIKKELGEQ